MLVVMMGNRGTDNKKLAQQAQKECIKDVSKYLAKNGNVKIDELERELDFERYLITQSIASLVTQNLVKANTDIEFSLSEKAGRVKIAS